MTLNEIYRAVDELPADDLDALQDYIEQRKRQTDIQRLRSGLAALRKGLTETEIQQIEQAMNAKIIPKVDLSEWKD
jgi:hypothetical protein